MLSADEKTSIQARARIHASWLNRIEVYFSVIQRKALTPNGFPSLDAVEERLLGFERHYESIATPFEWKFTRRDLAQLLHKLDHNPPSETHQKAA